MNNLHLYLNSLVPISNQSYLLIENEFTIKKIQKNTILCNIGDIPKNIYHIKSGMIRAYTVDEKGKEYTKSLFRVNQFAASLSALIKNEPSKLVYETITECEVLEGNYTALRKISSQNIEVANIALRMLEMFYLSIENKLFEFTIKDAKDRYLSLIKRFENIEKLIPQYQIATILGITPIQLSRIRKKLK